jgi:hypothetical protein
MSRLRQRVDDDGSLVMRRVRLRIGDRGGGLELDKPLNCIIHHGSLLNIVTNAGIDACCLPSLPSLPTYYLPSTHAPMLILYTTLPNPDDSVIRIHILGGDEECKNTACIIDIA